MVRSLGKELGMESLGDRGGSRSRSRSGEKVTKGDGGKEKDRKKSIEISELYVGQVAEALVKNTD